MKKIGENLNKQKKLDERKLIERKGVTKSTKKEK